MTAAFGGLAIMVGLVSIMVVPGTIMRIRDVRRERTNERESAPVDAVAAFIAMADALASEVGE